MKKYLILLAAVIICGSTSCVKEPDQEADRDAVINNSFFMINDFGVNLIKLPHIFQNVNNFTPFGG